MRRVLSSVFLALLLVGAQQSALVHEIGHGLGQGLAAAVGPRASISGPGERADIPATSDAGNYCEKCFQFAHVAAAIAAHVPDLIGRAPAADSLPHAPATALAADAPQSRSRGPPVLL